MDNSKHLQRVREETDAIRGGRKSSTKRGILFAAAFIIFGLFFAKMAPTLWPKLSSSVSWNLVLINNVNPLPESFTVKLGEVEGKQVDARIVKDLKGMLSAARKDGVDLILRGGYRSLDTQRELYEKKLREYQSDGYSRENSVKMVGLTAGKPGFSDYHTGLAVDITSTAYRVLNSGFEDSDAYRWLEKNASAYGFILRNPKGKEEITGIQYEPWHFRYVGDAAAEMQKTGDCLEEYVEPASGK